MESVTRWQTFGIARMMAVIAVLTLQTILTAMNVFANGTIPGMPQSFQVNILTLDSSALKL